MEEAKTWHGSPQHHPGLQELETSAWLADAAFRAAGLLDAPLQQILELEAEDQRDRLVRAAQH